MARLPPVIVISEGEDETAIGMMIAVICETYGFSAAEVYREHRRELAAKGYLKLVKGGKKHDGHHHQGRAGHVGPALAAGGA